MRKQLLIKFEKVSLDQWRADASMPYFNKDWFELDDEQKKEIDQAYENIKLPTRSSMHSAGYDFFLPRNVDFNIGYRTIPTGIRWVCDLQAALLLMPRSGLGFKYGTYLANTIGVIDADYSLSDNEGHIMAKMNSEQYFSLEAGKAFMQGIMVPFFTTVDDDVQAKRNGGFGSSGV